MEGQGEGGKVKERGRYLFEVFGEAACCVCSATTMIIFTH